MVGQKEKQWLCFWLGEEVIIVNSQKEIEKIIKPKKISLILITLICLGPFGHLVLRVIENDSGILQAALFTFPSLIFLGAYWSWHMMKCRNLKDDIYEAKKLIEGLKE